MIWSHLCKNGCELVDFSGAYRFIYLTPALDDETKSRWLIGPYSQLTPLATALRTDVQLRDQLAKLRVRLGLRKTDVPPADVERKERYGTTVQGPNHTTVFERPNPTAQPARDNRPTSPNRITDQRLNVKQFWDTQTPQSHHIVEFNQLETLGVSKRIGVTELDHAQLPCVLLAAEFHQRYISVYFKQFHRLSAIQLSSEMHRIYHQLYVGRSVLFGPLWNASSVILRQAGITVV